MRPETLSEILNSFSGDHPALSLSSELISARRLLDEADDLYQRSFVSQSSRIALCALAPKALVSALVAFDGKVEAMLLLPASLDEATIDQLVIAAGCTHAMNADGVRALPNCHFVCGSSDHVSTQWLLATSGTTGTPKLIAHRLSTLTSSVKRDRARGRGFVWGLLYDPSRFAGLQVILQALFSGAQLVVSQPNKFEVQLDAFVRHRINALSATPSLWRKMLMDGRIKNCPLQQITLGGEIADQQILDALRRCFPAARVVHIYASTEAGIAFAVDDCQAGFSVAWLQGEDSPIPLRIRDDGHLLIRPSKLPGGSEIVRRLDADGYLDTEDLVRVEGDRVLFLGRASGAINVGGNKVMPEAVEQHIRCVGGVLDVRVFGKKSSIMGQLVAAEVVAGPEVDVVALRAEILSHCRSHLEKWQIPGLISFVDQLQENMAGKRVRLI